MTMKQKENSDMIDKVIEKRLTAVLEAFVTGDAMGMATEFMTRKEIIRKFGGWVTHLIDTKDSKLHKDLPVGSVTDDSEENLFLMEEYEKMGEVTVEATVEGLLRWIRESDALEKKYIGPSASKALTDIKNGGSPYESGRGGTTCGGIMRTPCAFLFSPGQAEDQLAVHIWRCLVPTHNTSEAMEAAGAYGFALRAAFLGESFEEIIDAAMRGGERLLELVEEIHSAPSSSARIKEVVIQSREMDECQLMEWLHDVLGSGLSSADVCGAVFGAFAMAGGDVFKAVCMGASMGGDTDTIAALAGALSTAFVGNHNIPGDILETVKNVNHLDLAGLADRALEKK